MKNDMDDGKHSEKDAPVVSLEMSPDSSSQPEQLNRIAALKILGLDENANAYLVDNRFWQLTKRYRAEKNDDKLKEVTEAYEVASGRAAAKKVEETQQQQAKKYFGKSIRQWNVFFYYAWWKILLILLCAVLGVSFLYQMVIRRDYDIKIVGIGHFTMDNTLLTDYSIHDLGYKNPYITVADLVADGSETQNSATIYGAAAAAAFLGLDPDVILFDAKTMPYYLSTVVSLDTYYAELQDTLPKSLFDKITPLTSTMKDFYELTAVEGDKIEIKAGDEARHIYGLQISDPELIRALGVANGWQSQKASLVFSVCGSSKDKLKAQEFITSVFRDQNEIIARYEAANPSKEDTTTTVS